TGESPTVSHDEHKRVVEWCIEEAKGRVPVIAGAGSNSTREAIDLAEHAERAGADAVLVVTPYYNKPTQEGMYQHFKAINDAIGIAWQKGDLSTALKLHDKLMPLHTNLFIESNPAPIKYALSLLGKLEEKLRLPMVPVAEPTRVAVRSAMVHAGLIN